MLDNFKIYPGNPVLLGNNSLDDDSIGDALQDIFPMDTDDCIIEFNLYKIHLQWKYDISIIFDDIIILLDHILSNNYTELIIHWPSDTFRTDWVIKKDNSNIYIHSQWGNIIGGNVKYLNENNKLKVNEVKFLHEWNKILKKVICALNSSGYPDKEEFVHVKCLSRYIDSL